MRRNVRGVHGRFPFDRPREERVPEADGERRSNLCELRVLKRKRRWRFGPDEQVRLFHGGGEADSRAQIRMSPRGMALRGKPALRCGETGVEPPMRTRQ